MRRLLAMAGVLLSMGLATGCVVDHEASPPPQEITREEARQLIREVAAEAVREQFGALPEPQVEDESPCDYGRWGDDDRAYHMQGKWTLPLAPEDHQETLRAVYRESGEPTADYTQLGNGRFRVSARVQPGPISYTVESNDPPTTVTLSVASWCLLDVE